MRAGKGLLLCYRAAWKCVCVCGTHGWTRFVTQATNNQPFVLQAVITIVMAEK